MVDILVRGMSEKEAKTLKSLAAREKRSLNEFAREALLEKVRNADARHEELWREVDAIRESIGPLPDDSTDFIREWREKR